MAAGCLAPLDEGWLELENDPGLFALLLHDLGLVSIDVKEVYNIDAPIEEKAYGFVFLYNCHGSSSGEAKKTQGKVIRNQEKLRKLFFAHQMIENACATHSLLNVVMNLKDDRVQLGDQLEVFKNFTKGMSPEVTLLSLLQHEGGKEKGLAIGNSPFLVYTHNKHAGNGLKKDKLYKLYNKAKEEKVEIPKSRKKGGGSKSTTGIEGDTFHFVSYVMVEGHLMEMNSLNRAPIDYGEMPEGKFFEEHCQSLIKERVERLMEELEENPDTQFSLLALVPSQIVSQENKIKKLVEKQDILQHTNQADVTTPDKSSNSLQTNNSQPRSMSQTLEEDLLRITLASTSSAGSEPPAKASKISTSPKVQNGSSQNDPNEKENRGVVKGQKDNPDLELAELRREIESALDEKQKLDREWRETVLRDSQRRRHNYDPFIRRFFQLLMENGHLVREDNAVESEEGSP